ncbi:hypothetical protein DESACE_06160 [Desulfurella acetivorans A63]|nr:hypothetical protein DESACE_06160 [Desulfurella acetivorans A63]
MNKIKKRIKEFMLKPYNFCNTDKNKTRSAIKTKLLSIYCKQMQKIQ